MKVDTESKYRELFLEIGQYVKKIEHNEEHFHSTEATINDLKSLLLKYLYPE
ncbi:hypothetical protein [Guptibacillus hwajinpoensis]|uniref:Spo0E like sporulation regulatory protein n=1 Tax=Guptibacillus hwajinpoensis TaxID=208199 RepID=A0ABU0K303_9BACL|nr:hypothetical protein [Alkalihalobacillus hemicentroti]MDQ0482532.1 hypothetical protein [Alkalihalobacillus hemicentroti]